MMVLPLHVEFPNTSWTLIDAIRDPAHPQHDEALQQLARRYWPPVYAYLRRSGRNQHEALDLAQGFFATVVLQRRLFEHADGARGRLRALVLTALKNYVVDEHRLQSTTAHQALGPFEALPTEDTILDGETSADPERVYDRRWALSVLEEALQRCEQHFKGCGKARYWQAFEACALVPSLATTSPVPHLELAGRLGMPDADSVTQAVRLVRKRMLMMLRQVAADTAADPADQEAEYNRVISLLS